MPQISSPLQHEVSMRNWRKGRIACILNQISALLNELDEVSTVGLARTLETELQEELNELVEEQYAIKTKHIKESNAAK